ncbi:proteasome subunit beta [Spiractinospora alimapuensis]|nr:proteasome subunit beta [Spiractinospora alimapuensis]
MSASFEDLGPLPRPFNRATSSIVDYLRSHHPDTLPFQGQVPGGVDPTDVTPRATTVLAMVYADGVLLAGDRRATAGNVIASRKVDKLYRTDEFSAIAFAGSAAFGAELAKLYRVQLEHYEKMEGHALSLEGKANQLSAMIRGNLGMAMQGFPVVPLLVGFDENRGIGRIYSFDIGGDRNEEDRYYCVGSGSLFASGALKKMYRPSMPQQETVLAAVQALYDAADEDTATGGPDLGRRIFPLIEIITEEGHQRLSEEDVAAVARQVVAERSQEPDGPTLDLG